MNIFTIISALIGLTCLLLAMLIMKFGNFRSLSHRTLLLLNLSLTVWGFSCVMVSISKNPNDALFWWKIAHIGGAFSIVYVLENVLVVTETKKRWPLLFGYMFAITFQIFSFTNLLDVKMVLVRNMYYHITPNGITYTIFCICWIVIGLYANIYLYNNFRKSAGHQRLTFKYLLIAFALGTSGGIAHFFTVFSPKILPYGGLLLPLFPALTTYAILRHQLLDIEVIIKRTLIFAGLLASIFAILILPTLLIQEYILRAASTPAKLIGLAISGTIIILTMRRIEIFLINVTDKYLFQKKYDYKELLKTFTTEVLTILELGNLVDLTVNKLTDIVKLKSCAVLLFDDEKQEFSVTASKGLKDETVTLIRPDGIVTFMEETHGYILVKELHKKKVSIPSSIQEIIDKLNAELIIPMVLHNEVIGVLSLGKKKSDEDYSQDDLDILLPLAKTLAIAISNAELFVELGQTQAEAAQAEKMAVIGTLSAGINHEICNPLGIARGQCEAFLLNISDGLYKHKSNEELLAKAKEIMAKVIKETDRATAITKKLSQFAKPSKGESELVAVEEEVEEVIGLVGHELKLEKIEFHKNIEPGLPNIFVDKKQFGEVLFNLIRNAGQAIGEKGRVTVSARQGKGKVFIDVQDTGSGISEENAKKLFNPFFTTKDPGKGTGLGLFIVRQVVEKNGGRIYLKETRVSEGTTFTLEFPPAPAEVKSKA
jgi:signal transduction histidine kinase